jgi:hypothetical protein
MSSLNLNSIALKVATQAKRQLAQAARQRAESEIFVPAAKELQNTFESHPVTQEIAGGISASNISDTLAGIVDGEGKNLYSFIGFEAGDDPIDKIRPYFDYQSPVGPKLNFLSQRKINVRSTSLTIFLSVTYPDLNTLYGLTPMPWANGLSWADRIEKGIPNLQQFLNTFDSLKSRSGGGIQVKNPLRSASFKSRPYLSEIIKVFIKNFAGSNRKPFKL